MGERIPIKTLGIGNAAALAEMWYGAGRGARDLIAFSIGPSVFAGVISNGRLLAGAHGVGKELRGEATPGGGERMPGGGETLPG